MENSETYKLYGYIEYVSSPIGFVTPVFKGKSDEYFIQVSSTSQRRKEWERLPDEYVDLLVSERVDEHKDGGTSFLYGFKWNEALFFGKGKDMAQYLSRQFLPQAKLGRELATCFIEDWASLEPVSERLPKEYVWERCLSLIKNASRTMPGIFLANFEVIKFNDGLLTIRSKNESVKEVFETKFKDQIVSNLINEIEDFQINIIQSSNTSLPQLPFVHFGWEDPLSTQGSFIIQTKINHFKDFTNFIVSSFNSDAYYRAVDVAKHKLPPFLTIRGAAGVGKTHLVHSIAKHTVSSKKKVGIFTFLSNPENKKEISESDIEQFEATASENDVIIIDDAHNINSDKKIFRRVTMMLKKWTEMNKSVILSYRDTFQMHLIPEFLANSEQLILTQPEEVDRLKIIELKRNDYNLHLTGSDILLLSKDVKLINISDIQKHLTRVYLIEHIKTILKSSFVATVSGNDFSSKLVEYCVYEYFNLNIKSLGTLYPDVRTMNAKIISNFIQDIFMVSHHGTKVNSEMTYVDGLFYSIDILQNYLLKNEAFKETVLNILKELVLKEDKQE